jgi:cell division protease FtsH
MMTQLDLTKRLIAMMGGAAAESYVFATLSTGVEDDLDQATKIAHEMVAVYGMSPAVGPVTVGEKEGQVFIGRDLTHMGNVASAALELVDSETRRMVHEAEDTAKQVLAMNAQVLQDLANSLVRAETLSGPSLDVYMEAVAVWPEPLIKELVDFVPPVVEQPDPAESHGDQGHPPVDGDRADTEPLWDDESER